MDLGIKAVKRLLGFCGLLWYFGASAGIPYMLNLNGFETNGSHLYPGNNWLLPFGGSGIQVENIPPFGPTVTAWYYDGTTFTMPTFTTITGPLTISTGFNINGLSYIWPPSILNGGFMKTDNAGNLSWSFNGSSLTNIQSTNIVGAVAQLWGTNALNGSITNANGGGVSIGPGTNGPAQIYLYDATGTNLLGGFDTNTHKGFFSANLIPNTVIQADGTTSLISIANSTGPLTNNGSGTFGYDSGMTDNLWTNATAAGQPAGYGLVDPVLPGNVIYLGRAAGINMTNVLVEEQTEDGNSFPSGTAALNITYSCYQHGASSFPSAVFGQLQQSGHGSSTVLSSAAVKGINSITNTDSVNWLFNGHATYGVYGGTAFTLGGSIAGSVVGIGGAVSSKQINQAGSMGYALATANSQTNIGVVGIANKNTRTGGASVGVYGAVVTNTSTDPVLEDSVSIFDNWTASVPLSIWRSNNVDVARIDANGNQVLNQGIYYGNGAGLTNLVGVDTIITTTNIFNIAKGATLILTNGISFITNVWPQGPTGVVQVATNYVQNFVSLTACSITGLIGKTPNQLDSTLLTLYNSSGTNWNLTLAAGINDASGLSSIPVPAGGKLEVYIEYNPLAVSPGTNCVSHAFPSSPLTATVNGTANQITVIGGTENLTTNVSWTASIANPLVAPGPVSGTQLTNTSFAANGVVTNDSGGKLYTTPTLPVSLVGPFVRTIDIPMGAWFTNNCGNGADVTVASMLTLTNSGDTPVFTVNATTTNEIRTRFSLPRDWDNNAVQLHTFWACSGTNSAAQSKTNIVVHYDAAAVGPADRLDNLTFGTAVYWTNNVNPFPYEQGTEGITSGLTIGNSPAAGKGVIWRIQVDGNAAGTSVTNSSLYLAGFTVEYRSVPSNTFSTPQ